MITRQQMWPQRAGPPTFLRILPSPVRELPDDFWGKARDSTELRDCP